MCCHRSWWWFRRVDVRYCDLDRGSVRFAQSVADAFVGRVESARFGIVDIEHPELVGVREGGYDFAGSAFTGFGVVGENLVARRRRPSRDQHRGPHPGTTVRQAQPCSWPTEAQNQSNTSTSGTKYGQQTPTPAKLG